MTATAALPTTGGGLVALSGVFGLFQTELTRLVVTYGPAANPGKYAATGCVATTGTGVATGSVLTCSTTAGLGTSLSFKVTADNVASTAVSSSVSYAGPVVTGVSPGTAANPVLGDGTATVTITGSGFGPAGDGTATVTAGPYSTTSCTVVSDSTASCYVVGAGASIPVTFVVSGRTATGTVTLTFNRPVIQSVSASPTLMATAGGDAITITGTNFGPSTTSGSQPVSATYVTTTANQPTATFTATGCSVVSQTTITCRSGPGYGRDLSWTVVVGGQASAASSSLTAYSPPTITSMSGATGLLTSGGATLTLSGTNFGVNSTSNVILVTYYWGTTADGAFRPQQAPYQPTCTVSTAHTTIQCTAMAGFGGSLLWTVSVAGQASPTTTGVGSFVSSYAVPTISSLVAVTTPLGQLSTLGTDSVEVHGLNFGPDVVYNTITATLSGSASRTSPLTNIPCTRVTAGTVVRCQVPASVGGGYVISVTVGGQTSPPSTSTVSYAAPVMSSVIARSMSTSGGSTITISGSGFGPANTPGSYAKYYMSGGPVIMTSSCTTVSDIQLTCVGSAGVGSGLTFQVCIVLCALETLCQSTYRCRASG